MSQVFRKKNYNCGDKPHYMEEINCVHWEVDVSSCKKRCKLNLYDNPQSQHCIPCQYRKGYPDNVLAEDAKTHEFTKLTIAKKDPKTFTQKAKSYVKAEASQILEGTVDDEIYSERKAECLNCPANVRESSGQTDEVGWCKSCGCGLGSDRARLSKKLRMPNIICPKGKFGPAAGKGFNVVDAVDSVKGAIKIIKKAIG